MTCPKCNSPGAECVIGNYYSCKMCDNKPSAKELAAGPFDVDFILKSVSSMTDEDFYTLRQRNSEIANQAYGLACMLASYPSSGPYGYINVDPTFEAVSCAAAVLTKSGLTIFEITTSQFSATIIVRAP
jgi:hypothetical protein